MRREHLGEDFGEVLQHMKTVCNLRGTRGSLTCALGIRTGPIPSDHFHPGVCLEPLRHCFGRAIRQKRYRLVALQIDEDRAIGVSLPQGKIIHPEHGGRGERWGRLPAEQAQQGVPAHGQTPALAQADASLAA